MPLGVFLKGLPAELGGGVRKIHVLVEWVDIIQWVLDPDKTKKAEREQIPTLSPQAGSFVFY